MTIISIICCILDFALLCLLIYKIIKEKHLFLKEYSSFYVPLFIISITLLISGYIYEGVDNPLIIIFDSIYNSFKMITLNVSRSNLAEALKNIYFECAYYAVALLYAYITFSLVIDLFFNKIVNFFKNLIIKKNSLVVLGYNENAKTFIKSTKKRVYILLSSEDKKIKDELMHEKKHVAIINKVEDLKRFAKENNIFISFEEDILKQYKLIDYLSKFENDSYFLIKDKNWYLIKKMIKGTNLNIHFFNKHQLTSDLFVSSNNFSRSFGKILDTKTGTVNADSKINAFLIGFGGTNKTLYLNLVKFYQFITIKNDKFVGKPVNYYIFDKNNIEDNLFNHTIKRMEYLDINDEYFPKCDQISNTTFEHLDINNFDFYKKIKDYVSITNGFNAFIISFGDDLQNVELALRLKEKLHEWNVKSNTNIYVKIDNARYESIIKDNGLIPFGTVESVINEDVIINEKLLGSAKVRAYNYEKERNPNTKLTINEVWKKLDVDKKRSNSGSVISILQKLGMMGLQVTNDKSKAISREEYFKIYDNFKEIQRKDGNIVYPTHFTHTLSLRNAMAYQEHNRWNANMIVNGYVPMKKSLITYKDDGTKVFNSKNLYYKDSDGDSELKYHSCITSFDGLDELFDLVSKTVESASGIPYDEVYKNFENKRYDYQLMDNAYDEITKSGGYIMRY